MTRGGLRNISVQSLSAIRGFLRSLRGIAPISRKAVCRPEFSMHFMATWRYQSQDVAARNKVNSEITTLLSPYSWVRPLEDTYVINVPDQAQYNLILTRLLAIMNANPNVVHLLISPPMTGGQYGGYLPSNYWKDINARSV
jgi:hypothetical protein